MAMRKTVLTSALAFALLAPSAAQAAPPVAAEWNIGPIIRGKNYSQGMPLRPDPSPEGWQFRFPAPDAQAGHVHYVTRDMPSLRGKSRIVLRYRVDAAEGARFVPQEFPDRPATVSLFLQRRDDTWTARGRFEHYRWYAPADSVQEIAPGVHRMTVSLDDPQWISVYGRTAAENRAAFDAALADIARIGLVFGSSGGRGHGVFATAPARFTLLDFTIE